MVRGRSPEGSRGGGGVGGSPRPHPLAGASRVSSRPRIWVNYSIHGPPTPQLKNSIFGPAGPRDPLRILGRIGGNRSPLFPSKSVVIGPIFGQKTVWPMYALVYPDIVHKEEKL